MSQSVISNHKSAIPLRQALPLAEKIVEALRAHCERIAIAGSIRRRKPIVGDIEIVCIPKRVENLIGEPGESLLDPELDELINADRLRPGRCRGEKYAQFDVPAVDGLNLDLFMTTPGRWGVILAIRTGPADYSKWLVTQRRFGGALPDDMRIEHGQLIRGSLPGHVIDTPTEESFFEAIDQPWTAPGNRSAQ